tara:strand:+ start:242 stop:433 length:192 start_codon:yes stop_codon:yes gene_type:complete
MINNVKHLIEVLKKHNPNNRVVFYNLENRPTIKHNLTECNLESIIDCKEVNQTEITITHEEEE